MKVLFALFVYLASAVFAFIYGYRYGSKKDIAGPLYSRAFGGMFVGGICCAVVSILYYLVLKYLVDHGLYP